MSGLIGVTGATGEVGGRVARALADQDVDQRLVVRDAARAPEIDCEISELSDYEDFESMAAAAKGVDTLFLVSAREHRDRLRQHLIAVDAAVAAGVKHIVYTSFLNARPDTAFTLGRQHFHTEEHIKAKGIKYTFLRNCIYLDFVPWFSGPDGVIRGPAGNGRLAPVARDDVADVAVAILTEPAAHENRTYRLTGPELFSMYEAAEKLSRVSGREVRYIDETIEQAWESRSHYGAPDWEVEGWISSYVAIAEGEMEVVSDDVPRVAGHPAQSLPEYLAAHPESYAHLLRSDAGT